MESISVYAILIIVYSIVWITLIIGITLIRKRNKRAERMHKLFLNKSIQKFRHAPFKNLLKLWIAKKFLSATTAFIFLIILPAVILFFLLGIILIFPFLAILQGLTVGILIGYFKKRNMYWAVMVGMFEFGYWALSGALGLSVTIEFLLNDISFIDSLSNGIDKLLSGYWIPLVVCIIGNAFLEIAGPIYWNMNGPISLEVLAQGQYVDE